MRVLLPAAMVFALASGLALAAGCLPDAGAGTGADSGAAADGGAAEAAVLGGACGIESTTGSQLCKATSACPTVVVDTDLFPHCGFRIRGAAVDLVCGCGTAVCPMGIFATCEQAAKLLATQTEQGVCTQLADERCVETAGTPPTAAGTPPTSTSSGGNPACDRQCVKDCGGGGACSSICNCD